MKYIRDPDTFIKSILLIWRFCIIDGGFEVKNLSKNEPALQNLFESAVRSLQAADTQQTSILKLGRNHLQSGVSLSYLI